MLVTSLGERAPEWVTSQMIVDAMVHLKARFPEEGCGVFKSAGFVPLENVAARFPGKDGEPMDPKTSFVIDPDAWADMDDPENPILGVVHSHTNGVVVPGQSDMESQIISGVPWAIMVTDGDVVGEPVWFGDQLPIPPLFGRPFIHGICDCYSLIRDAYRLGRDALKHDDTALDQRIYDWPFDAISLPMGCRDDEWWEKGGDLYNDNWKPAGFYTVAEGAGALPEELQVGDVFLAKLRSPVVNHGGIYVGNGLILHHVTGYNSHRTTLNLWQSRIERWLRLDPTKVPKR